MAASTTASPARRSSAESKTALVVIALISVGAAVATAIASGSGLVVSPDSVSFLRMADRLPPLEHPAGHFPEGYPVVLAGLQAIGFGPLGAARWLGVALAALDAGLAGWIGWRMAGPRWGALTAGALASATTVTPLYSAVWSEALFVTLLLCWVLTMASERRASLALAGALAAAAFLVRYAGFAVVAAGTLVLVREPRRLVAYAAGAGVPLSVWVLAHLSSAGGLTDRHLRRHEPTRAAIEGAVAETWTWVTGRSGSLLTGGVVVIVAALLLWRVRTMRGGSALGIVAATYIAVLGITVTFLDAQTPLDRRLLSPLNVIVVLALPALSTLPASRLLSIGVVGVIGLNLVAGQPPHPPQLHYLDFDRSPTVRAAKRLEGRIASNAPGALWLINGVEATWIPRLVDPNSASAEPDYDAQMRQLRDELARGGHLVWLDAFDYRTYLPSEERTVQTLDLRLAQELPDGAIYRAGVGDVLTSSS